MKNFTIIGSTVYLFIINLHNKKNSFVIKYVYILILYLWDLNENEIINEKYLRNVS